MPARTKGRAKFDHHGRKFVWWIQDEKWLRIASLDKGFVVAYSLYTERNEAPELQVIGKECPRIRTSERPINVKIPAGIVSNSSIGAMVESLLTWSFDELANKEFTETGTDK